jgi:hypothetical protein
LEIKEKINPNAIGFGGNGTVPTNKIEGFKERIDNVTYAD